MEAKPGSLLLLWLAWVPVVGSPDGAEAAPRLSLFGGLQCDSPVVRDFETFPSSCSAQPLVGAALGLPGLGPLELDFEAQYGRRSFRSPAFVTNTDVRVELAELALLCRWRFWERPRGVGLSAVLGPRTGIVLGARRRFRDVDQDIADELRGAELEIVTALRFSRRSFFAEGGLAWGMTNLDNTNQQEIYSRNVFVKLGFVHSSGL